MKRVVILGAAGRDFHNFNLVYKNSAEFDVVAFTAAQIPGIERRTYPPELAGPRYPNGIPVFPEHELPRLIREKSVDLVVLAYSDLSYREVMSKASIAMSAGADFQLFGPKRTMLGSKLPVVSIGAVRTGAGKSTVSRRVCSILRENGRRVVVIRHPMPYGNLSKEVSQRFGTLEDLDKYECSIEEREEYEPHIEKGFVVFAGVDYEKILRSAEEEGDIIVWDGGNNDTPFIKPNVHLVVLDPLRPGNELTHYPSEQNVRMADAVIINKVDAAESKSIELVESNARHLNPDVTIIRATSEITVDNPEAIKGKRVLVIEDGPTVTHGDMTYGVGFVAAKRLDAAEIVDPRQFAVGIVKDTYRKYPHLTQVLPTVGYGSKQISDLEATIGRVECDSIVVATPADIRRIIKITKPTARVSYELKEVSKPSIEEFLRWKKIIG